VLSKVEVKVGAAGVYTTASGTESWSASVTLPSGSNTIYAQATDINGNHTETSITVTYNPPDTTLPVISITSPTADQIFTTNAITVNGTASNNVGVVEVKVGVSGVYTTASGTESWNAPVTLESGSNTIYARATDTAGNTRETSVTVTYNPLNTTLPVISIISPIAGQIFTTNAITVSGTTSNNVDVVKAEVKVGNGSWVLASGNTSWIVSSMTLSAGSNMITAKATDSSNNTYETSVNVTYSLPGHKDTSSGGGGGGGGSGVTSGENFTNIIIREKHDMDIFRDKVTSYAFSDTTNPILFVNISGIEVLEKSTLLSRFSETLLLL